MYSFYNLSFSPPTHTSAWGHISPVSIKAMSTSSLGTSLPALCQSSNRFASALVKFFIEDSDKMLQLRNSVVLVTSPCEFVRIFKHSLSFL